MTKSKAPDISVSAHIEESTRILVGESGTGNLWLSFGGDNYPWVAILMSRAKLAEARDVIAAYLDSES